jgi:hypothetical protein
MDVFPMKSDPTLQVYKRKIQQERHTKKTVQKRRNFPCPKHYYTTDTQQTVIFGECFSCKKLVHVLILTTINIAVYYMAVSSNIDKSTLARLPPFSRSTVS